MKNFNQFRKFLFALAILFAVTLGTVIAQTDPAGPGTDDPENEGPPVGGGNVPLDGGAIFMLIAGVAYGIKRIKGKNKE